MFAKKGYFETPNWVLWLLVFSTITSIIACFASVMSYVEIGHHRIALRAKMESLAENAKALTSPVHGEFKWFDDLGGWTFIPRVKGDYSTFLDLSLNSYGDINATRVHGFMSADWKPTVQERGSFVPVDAISTEDGIIWIDQRMPWSITFTAMPRGGRDTISVTASWPEIESAGEGNMGGFAIK